MVSSVCETPRGLSQLGFGSLKGGFPRCAVVEVFPVEGTRKARRLRTSTRARIAESALDPHTYDSTTGDRPEPNQPNQTLPASFPPGAWELYIR